MTEEEPKKSPSENFAEMMKDFGSAVAEIFNDPQLKEKAKEFGDSAVNSAKTFASRFKDEDVKKKFDDLGSTAKKFGDSVADYFKDDTKKTGSTGETSSSDKENYSSGEASQSVGQSLNVVEPEAAKEFSSSEKSKYGNTSPSGGVSSSGDQPLPGVQTAEIPPGGQNKQNTQIPAPVYFPSDAQKLQNQKNARITGYCFAIAWSIILLVFFNFFNRYIAFYLQDPASGTWIITPLITDSFSLWFPFINVSLLVSIIGNVLLIINDSFYFDNITNIVMHLFGISAAASLLIIFPFDFSIMSTSVLSAILNPLTRIILIVIIVGLSIGILVRFIKIIVRTSRTA